MINIRRRAGGSQNAVRAARHICEEARVLLTSLRGGPPAVSRGELAQDLMELRMLAKAHLDAPTDGPPLIAIKATAPPTSTEEAEGENQTYAYSSPQQQSQLQVCEEDDGLEGAVLVQRGDAQAFITPESPIPTSKLCNISVPGAAKIKEVNPNRRLGGKLSPENVGPFVHPFLAVVMDPRAAGPHTLVALRALFRLVKMGSLLQPSKESHGFHVSFEPLMRGVLACKFEQTDAGADEAVEMAIADLVALLVSLNHRSIPPETLMDAFNTVFVTRNTFVHSPALCYHFEEVLSSMVVAIFQDLDSSNEEPPRLILEFLVNQLLHTPLVGGDVVDSSAHEAQVAHDATRVLCLHLVQCCLRTGWGDASESIDIPNMPLAPVKETQSEDTQDDINKSHNWEERSLLRIIQDDLCLSLLMTGQAIWAYHDASTNISPGVISLEVLSEICATLSTLWNTTALRGLLVSQFETIFTGFYQRALALLRRRRNPTDSDAFNANLVFDAEVEVILESLVDLLCLQDQDIDDSGEHGALDILFSLYDCHMNRSDVAVGLLLELCRCCGGSVDEEGQPLTDVSSVAGSRGGTGANTPTSDDASSMMPSETWRPVPAHLKELCVEVLLGAMKCLFRDGQPSISSLVQGFQASSTGDEEDLEEGLNGMSSDTNTSPGTSLRKEKAKKRLMRKATALFNKKSTGGLQFLVSSGLLPSPVTPVSVASFLRNALVVGLDKRAVGAYLGEIGKSPVAGKSPPCWERDWFHKDVLNEYCSLFRFERQSLLEGLRMFLASFRLPGEAQQIDRILQAFADSCGRTCDESSQGRLKLFSPDPKKASDAAYLLSFSIIMLNTDLHNDNIRDDRKMKMADFVKNNADYGKDITDVGHELPREFLESIYESIREEEIRTEGEGADGHMTVERWKDVLRGAVCDSDDNKAEEGVISALTTDSEGVKELLIENIWMPILSAIGALWGVTQTEDLNVEGEHHQRGSEGRHSGMLGAQGARLGMDMALEMLGGLQKFGRMGMFRNFFVTVCGFSGLLNNYSSDAVDRTWSFVNSVEAQSAVIVAIQIAKAAGADIGFEGWKCVWGMILELRDLKLLVGGCETTRQGILVESEPDLLSDNARREWTMRVIKGGWDNDGDVKTSRREKKGIFASLFGSQEDPTESDGFSRNGTPRSALDAVVHTAHGKEDLVIWDELAPSDDESDDGAIRGGQDKADFGTEISQYPAPPYGSAGAAFESQLIHEDFLVYHQDITPVTGLERVEDTHQYHISPRARVRKRLARTCDFSGLVSESRFMDLEGIRCLMMTLIEMVGSQQRLTSETAGDLRAATEAADSDLLNSSLSSGTLDEIPISPASEAFAEILICEIALKNRDRLGMLWRTMLHDHYMKRLGHEDPGNDLSHEEKMSIVPSPGLEKCVTGFLRICACAVLREEVANDVISSLKIFSRTQDAHIDVLHHFHKHVGEGLWRICRNAEGLQQLDADGWEGILGIAEWCAWRDGDAINTPPGLAEDDPALQCFRSLHLMLHSPELQNVVPFTTKVVSAIRALIVAGEMRLCPKLSIAGLDLLQLVHVRIESLIAQGSANKEHGSDAGEVSHWVACWMPVLEGMAAAAEQSRYMSVREHALLLITDAFIDKHGRTVPAEHLCDILQRICIPLVGKRLDSIFEIEEGGSEAVLTEFELCVGLLFKPLLHHLKSIVMAEADIASVWKPILVLMENFFNQDERSEGDTLTSSTEATAKALLSAKELACEHLRNAVMVLLASGVLECESDEPVGISGHTWASLEKMKLGSDVINEWKSPALNSPGERRMVTTET